MLVRLAYLGVTNVFALLRLLPRSDHDKDTEILVLRHQLGVLQRQLGDQRIRFQPADRALLAALLHPLPRPALQRLRLLVRPDTVLRWHRELMRPQHAKRHRPHPGMDQAAPLHIVPTPIGAPAQIEQLRPPRTDRLGGILHAYTRAA